ncbi:MAG: Sapep family Mn(2+)-dependent dipeptidase [Clostridia bacterium]|nr:Sapep family Mn(2+)-dependent dipeptidase [Clostridia bacterium]
MGEGEETFGILCHADIVPAGDGWDRDPFGAQLDGGRVYGRGASDNKGPAAAALFAMKAVKDAGIQLNKKVRLIIGCDEESGMECMAYYKRHADLPRTGFSPDAAFPLINTEKGLLQLDLRAPASQDGRKVLSLHVGERRNVIPGIAQALVEGGQEVIACVQAVARATGFDLTAWEEAGAVRVKAVGAAGHAAFPQGAKNAIGRLLICLKALGVTGPLEALADKVGTGYDGKALGCDVQDGLSDALTLNLGILRADDTGIFATFDIRYPVMASHTAIQSAIRLALPLFDVTESSHKAPHHVPESSELVQSLLRAYSEETGRPGGVMAIGGGTYARCLEQGVAFGASFPEDEEVAHQANEYADIRGLMTNVRIFANAIIRLAGEGS